MIFSSSGAVNVYRNPTLHTGTETFIATYYPSDWTGQLQAIGITTDSSDDHGDPRLAR